MFTENIKGRIMKKYSDKGKIILAFLFLLILSIIMDVSKGEIRDGVIDRDEIGGEDKTIELELDAEKLFKKHDYALNVLPTAPTKEAAEEYFESAITQINQDFEAVTTKVPMQKMYLDGAIKAEWSFLPFGIIDSTGMVYSEKLEADTIVQAQVELTCGAYEQIYTFSFLLPKPELTEEELLLQKIEKLLEEQMLLEGNSKVKLPTEIDGRVLVWKEKKEYLTPQMLLLEVVALVFIGVISKRARAEEEKKRLQEMERDYADVVSQLSLLLGAGMTMRQAWNRLAMQYSFKKNNFMMSERPVYEAILRMNGRLAEGVGERMAYQQFREEIPAPCYHKLVRILLGNLEKGNQGITATLEEESRQAFEQRILQAKKRGEEASTKMLGPLMLIMLVVMGIVMLPALIGFRI